MTVRGQARSAVWKAVKNGELKREPCEVCSSPITEAHHPDYSKPLEVNWFCRLHHRLLHKDDPRRPHARKRRPFRDDWLAFTKAETAEHLGLPLKTINKFIKDGRLKARQLSTGHTIRILRSDLLAFLESRQLI